MPTHHTHDRRRLQTFVHFFDNILGSILEPLVLLDAERKIVKANLSFYRTFHLTPRETEGVLIYDLGAENWNIPRLKLLLETLLPEDILSNCFVIEHDFHGVGHKILHINARIITDNKNVTQLIFMAINDVTEREGYKKHLEDIVAERTAELLIAKEESDKRKQIAESSLLEIESLRQLLEIERAYLKEEIKIEYNHENIIGQSNALNSVFYKIEQIAGTDTNVLILGETGTGKELAARAIHGLSQRKDRALVKMNCAALPANLIESELFGHEKGAFTGALVKRLGRFEVANHATLFLDEIGELPLELQAKLLQVLQNGEFERLGSSQTIKVDVRIIAATNRDLEEEVRKGTFRGDLWYRLNVFPILMPPLRDRADDIPLLVNHFVAKIGKRLGKTIEIIPITVMQALQQYSWPGNVRELENVLERAVIVSSGPKLRLVDELHIVPFVESDTKKKTLEAVEREYIISILEQTKWKVGGSNSAAEILGLERSTLRGRMRKLGIRKSDA